MSAPSINPTDALQQLNMGGGGKKKKEEEEKQPSKSDNFDPSSLLENIGGSTGKPSAHQSAKQSQNPGAGELPVDDIKQSVKPLVEEGIKMFIPGGPVVGEIAQKTGVTGQITDKIMGGGEEKSGGGSPSPLSMIPKPPGAK